MKRECSTPEGKLDVVLDTDAYNEIDDQFALSYMLCSQDKLRVKAIYAAPFFNKNASSPEDGMKKSYEEILNLLQLAGETEMTANVYKGSINYMKDEKTPVLSVAAENLSRTAMEYSAENPLYIVAIGAITNIASALLLNPQIAQRIVIVWLGGHSFEYHDTDEFNMRQDIAAARVVFNCNAPLVLLPCNGVVSSFSTSRHELEHWLKGKNKLCDYLVSHTVREAESYASGTAWTRVIWDVTAVAWLLNENDRFMLSRMEERRMPGYDSKYENTGNGKFLRYVYYIKRDALFTDMFQKLAGKRE